MIRIAAIFFSGANCGYALSKLMANNTTDIHGWLSAFFAWALVIVFLMVRSERNQ